MSPEERDREVKSLRMRARFCQSPVDRLALNRKADRLEAEGLGESLPPQKPIEPGLAGLIKALDLSEIGEHPEYGRRWEGACPACRAEARDSTGNHLLVSESGRFACTVHRGEAGKEHRSKMVRLCPALAGGKSSGKPMAPRVSFAKEKEVVSAGFLELWVMIKKRLWTEEEDLLRFLPESAPVPTDLAGSVEVFCKAFKDGDFAWIGARKDVSEEKWALLDPELRRWNTRFRSHLFRPSCPEDRARIVQAIALERLDHASGRIFREDSTGRAEDQSTGLRFRIVEHDHDNEEDTPMGAQLAAIRYAREVLEWRLLWIMKTGGKGVHAAFDTAAIPPVKLSDDLHTLRQIGCDPNGLEKGATRCPGAMRRAIEPKQQALIWVSKDL